MKRCKWFGHKWLPVYIGKRGKWKIIGCYCSRCWYGHDELYNFLNYLEYKNGYDYGVYDEKYFLAQKNMGAL